MKSSSEFEWQASKEYKQLFKELMAKASNPAFNQSF